MTQPIKFTMLGMSNAGKTAYMASLFERFNRRHVANYRIEPTPDADNDPLIQAGQWAQIAFTSNPTAGGFLFPPGTAQTTRWEFDLLHEQNLVHHFEWIDYRGGILEEYATGSFANPALSTEPAGNQINYEQQVLNSIMDSQALLILVDSTVITQYDDLDEARYHSGIDWIHMLLRQYMPQFPRLVFNVILTKCDAVEADWKTDAYQPLIDRGMQLFDELQQLCGRYEWTGGIVPVSAIGENRLQKQEIVKDTQQSRTRDIIQFPRPLNVEYPVFFCLGFLLERAYQIADEATRDDTPGWIRRIQSWIGENISEQDAIAAKEQFDQHRHLYQVGLEKVQLFCGEDASS